MTSSAVIDSTSVPLIEARPPWWWRIACSFWLHLILCVIVMVAYNRAIQYYDLELSGNNGHWGFDPNAAPMYARAAEMDPMDRLHDLVHVLPPIGVFIAWVGLVIAQLRFWRVPGWLWVVTCFCFVLLTNITVNSIDNGPAVLAQPFARLDMEYFGDVRKVDEIGQFWQDYPDLNRSHRITHHAGTHPPGGVTFLWWVVRMFGEEGRWFRYDSLWAASLAAIVVTAISVVPVYLLARRLYGEQVAIIASGLYALTPNLVLFGATSMDGVFTVLPIFAIWLFHKAIKDRPIIYGVLFGLALAGGLLMTFASLCIGIITTMYGVVALAAIGVSAIAQYRRPRSAVPQECNSQTPRVLLGQFGRIVLVNFIALAVIALVHWGLYKWIGYNVLDAVDAARERNRGVMGTGLETWARYWDISFSNFFAFVIGVGMVGTTLCVRQFGRAIGRGFKAGDWDLFALSFLPALILISFSNLFTFEVERIWLFLTPFVIVAAAANVISHWTGRIRWVVLSAALLLLFTQTFLTQLVFYTYW
jgi:hypothetical protein